MRYAGFGVVALAIVAACGETETAPTGLNADIGTSANAEEAMLDAGVLSEEDGADEAETPAESELSTGRRAVSIGHDGLDFDACGGVGQVANLNSGGDNYLSVRDRPSADGAELDRLDPATSVWMCDAADNGWIGIVYDRGARGASAGDCGVSSPVDGVRDYDGLCRSGWVSDRYITLIAG